MKDEIQEKLTPVDIEEAFEESVRQCYPEEVTVGWMKLDTITVMKDQDRSLEDALSLTGNLKRKKKATSCPLMTVQPITGHMILRNL